MAYPARDRSHERTKNLHHHDKHAAHKDGHRPDDPHGVTAPVNHYANSGIPTDEEAANLSKSEIADRVRAYQDREMAARP